MKVFAVPLIMTGGGPNYATHVIGLDIWYNAFMYLKFGFATAEAGAAAAPAFTGVGSSGAASASSGSSADYSSG